MHVKIFLLSEVNFLLSCTYLITALTSITNPLFIPNSELMMISTRLHPQMRISMIPIVSLDLFSESKDYSAFIHRCAVFFLSLKLLNFVAVMLKIHQNLQTI